MVLNLAPEDIITELGHDGQEIFWKDLPAPDHFKGVHIQELQDIFFSRGYLLALVEPMPRSGPPRRPDLWTTVFDNDIAVPRITRMLRGRLAILIGEKNGSYHAVAWDGFTVFDPNGARYFLEDFALKEAWIVSTT
jgi:hypothetical protein